MIALLIALSVSSLDVSANTVRNGGDAVECRASSENSFNGFYSLDFLAQYKPDLLPAPAGTLDADLNRIGGMLRAKLPELYEDFAEFRSGLFNETNLAHSRYWERAPFGLVDLHDENLVTLLPANCRQGDRVSIVQAVIREPSAISGRPVDTYVYKYVPEVVEKLKQTNPVQLSFLLLHEWLWDFSSNVERNRRMNYWLHSSVSEAWTREEWVRNLEGIGFAVPGLPVPAFGPEVCPVDAESTKKLIRLVSGNDSDGLGVGQAYQRTRSCDEDRGCGARSSDSSENFRLNFRPQIALGYKNRLLVLRSRGGGDRISSEHFNCKVAGDRFECSLFLTKDGYTYSEDRPLKFQLEVGRGCARFTAKRSFSNGFKSVQVDEYALLFPILEGI